MCGKSGLWAKVFDVGKADVFNFAFAVSAFTVKHGVQSISDLLVVIPFKRFLPFGFSFRLQERLSPYCFLSCEDCRLCSTIDLDHFSVDSKNSSIRASREPGDGGPPKGR